MSLKKNVLNPSNESVLMRLGLIAAALERNAAIQKIFIWSGCPSNLALWMTALIVSNE